MSSHHVVREAQEPALLILQTGFFSFEHMAPLLEWSPTIVVDYLALPEVLDQQIKIDVVIYPKEQQEKVYRLVEEQEPISLIPLQEKETTLSTALNFLFREGHSAVNIFYEGQIESEESLKNVLISEPSILNIVLLSNKSRSALCRSGKYEKWFPAGEIVTLEAGPKEVVMSTSGFTTKLRKKTIGNAIRMETAEAGMVSVVGNAPFWVTEQLD